MKSWEGGDSNRQGDLPTKFVRNIELFNRMEFENKEDLFVKSWLAYHREHANYQLLCATCNAKKSNKNTKTYRKPERFIKPVFTECMI